MVRSRCRLQLSIRVKDVQQVCRKAPNQPAGADLLEESGTTSTGCRSTTGATRECFDEAFLIVQKFTVAIALVQLTSKLIVVARYREGICMTK